MLHWLNFLHFYQPANAPAHVIREAADESYVRIVKALERNPRARFTANISGCLLLRLDELGYGGLIGRFGKLVDRGQLELAGTAAYHPIIPLVGPDESRHQIAENEAIIRKYFGNGAMLKGFYFPECAVDQASMSHIADSGYEWTILDPISISDKKRNDPIACIDQESGLNIIVRTEELSKSYIPNTLKSMLESEKQVTTVSATDAELYGLRYGDWSGIFEEILKDDRLETMTISEFITGQRDLPACAIRPSNWESTEEELAKGLPYAIWRDPGNAVQTKLWELAGFARGVLEEYSNDPNIDWARWHYMRGLASCVFWWASGKDFAHVFGPVAWNPDEIERGMNDMVRAVRSIQDKRSRPAKLQAEHLYAETKESVWTKHWEEHF